MAWRCTSSLIPSLPPQLLLLFVSKRKNSEDLSKFKTAQFSQPWPCACISHTFVSVQLVAQAFYLGLPARTTLEACSSFHYILCSLAMDINLPFKAWLGGNYRIFFPCISCKTVPMTTYILSDSFMKTEKS